MNSNMFNNWLNLSNTNLNRGINFGHKSIRFSKTPFWHPLMSDFFLGIRENVSILNTRQTLKCLLRAFHIIALVLNKKGRILIINTNPEFFRLCNNLTNLTLKDDSKKASHLLAREMSLFVPSQKQEHLLTGKETSPQLSPRRPQLSCSFSMKNGTRIPRFKTPLLSYVSYKWIGGTLTNWKQISKSVCTFAKFSERCQDFLINTRLDFPKFNRVKKCFQGLLYKEKDKMFLAFKKKPDLIFLINPNENQSILDEAYKLHIPVIAFTESNTNPKGITFPIPVNNYSIKFMYFCLKKIIKMAHI
jgi:ribosomal protein S2